jgi:hypothetical protein
MLGGTGGQGWRGDPEGWEYASGQLSAKQRPILGCCAPEVAGTGLASGRASQQAPELGERVGRDLRDGLPPAPGESARLVAARVQGRQTETAATPTEEIRRPRLILEDHRQAVGVLGTAKADREAGITHGTVLAPALPSGGGERTSVRVIDRLSPGMNAAARGKTLNMGVRYSAHDGTRIRPELQAVPGSRGHPVCWSTRELWSMPCVQVR